MSKMQSFRFYIENASRCRTGDKLQQTTIEDVSGSSLGNEVPSISDRVHANLDGILATLEEAALSTED